MLKWFPISHTSASGENLLVHHLPAFFKDRPAGRVRLVPLRLAGGVLRRRRLRRRGRHDHPELRRPRRPRVRPAAVHRARHRHSASPPSWVRASPGREPSEIHRIHVNEDLTEDFFLLPVHRDRFVAPTRSSSAGAGSCSPWSRPSGSRRCSARRSRTGTRSRWRTTSSPGTASAARPAATSSTSSCRSTGAAFAEAVERLADKYGVQLRREEGDVREDRPKWSGLPRLIEAHREAQEFYAGQLATPDAVVARQFLAERGFDQAAAELFGIGFAPRDGEALKHLRQKAFSEEELVVGGLVAVGRSAYDRFRGRLLWPIRDASGDTIGFGARRIFDDDRIDAKYLTPTPIYKKSQVLYGIDLARRDIARSSQAVDRRGLHRCDGLPLRGRADRGRHLRHGLRRRPLAGPAPVPQRPRGVPRRGDLHVRRRRGRPEGRAARSAATRTSCPRRTSPSSLAWTCATCGSRMATPPCASWWRAGCRCTASCSPTPSEVRPRPGRRRVDALREAARLVSASATGRRSTRSPASLPG